MSYSGSARRKAALVAWALLALAAAGCSGAAQTPPADPPASPGGSAGVKSETQPVPGYKATDIVAKDVKTGQQVTLAGLKGKVVMLNFWATWCGPCRLEMPAMDAFQKEVGTGVRVLALGGDSGESPAQLAAYAKGLNLTFSVLHDGGTAILPYQVAGLPTTFFIDQNGVIRVRHTGPLEIEQMRQLAADTERMGKQQ
ncbi:MAG: thiol-disulfide isomerase and thioredoxin [Firmicutes bacterium]|nr:thiol-disulfide isomerase and thioredoxin [Bacillota bacterium]